MSRVLYVASVSYSGSTLLDLLLSTHPDVCGCGETHMIIENKARLSKLLAEPGSCCSCGAILGKCPLWKQLLPVSHRFSSTAQGYAQLIDAVDRLYGREMILSDSSKDLTYLKNLVDAHKDRKLDIEITLLHLVRDLRGVLASVDRREHLSFIKLLRWTRYWYYKNRAIENFAKNHGLPITRIMYEDLCLRPTETLCYIRELCQLSQSEIFGNLSEGRGHIGLGNSMRFDNSRSQGLRYDYRWFGNIRAQIAWLISGSARRYNVNLYD